MAENDNIPTSKIARASRYLKSGSKMGWNYTRHYGGKLLGQKAGREDLDKQNAEELLESFTQMRGLPLKFGQMLSMDNVNLPEAVGEVMQKAQYSVPAMSAPMAAKAFKSAVGKRPGEVFDKFEPEAARAASIGQVHIAWKDGRKLAVKIQYPGVSDTVNTDLKMMKNLARRFAPVPNKELNPYLDELEERFREELDYRNELENAQYFAEVCQGLAGIHFPRYYPEYSSDKVLVSEYVEGQHLTDFLSHNPSQEVRQRAARYLWDYYEFQIHQLHQLHADPNPGNFLFQPDGSIYALDFGCTKKLDNETYENFYRLFEPGLFDEPDQARQALRALGVLQPGDDEKFIQKITSLYGQLIAKAAEPYHRGTFDFSDPSHYEEMKNISMEFKDLGKLRYNPQLIFLNRTFLGLGNMMYRLGATLDTRCRYRDLLLPEYKQQFESSSAGTETA